MRWLLAPYTERRTYRILLYLLLGLPVGIFDFVLVVTGLALGLGLLVTLIGIPILVGTLFVARALATFERRLAWSLIDAPMPRLPLRRDEPRGVFWARLRGLIRSRRTWAELAYLLLRLPLGIIDFVVAVSIVGLMLQGAVEPLLVAAGVETNIGSWTINTIGESLVFLPISALFLLVGPRIIIAWGGVSARIATAMLGIVELRELKGAVGDVLARTGRADAFQIMDELELRLGRGPFLTPIRLEAALLGLESSGLVTARRDDPRTVYALA
jgi:Putative sensor